MIEISGTIRSIVWPNNATGTVNIQGDFRAADAEAIMACLQDVLKRNGEYISGAIIEK